MRLPFSTLLVQAARRGARIDLGRNTAGEGSLRAQVVATARSLERHGLVIGNVGNVSARRGDALWITPTRVPYARMTTRDVVKADVTRATQSPGASCELPLHRAVYRARSDVNAVVHTHSVHATAWSFLELPLEPATEDVAYWRMRIAVTPFAPPGSAELAAAVGRAVGDGADAVLIARHGVVAAGRTLDRALLVARVVEQQAQIAWLLRQGASA